VQENGLEYGKLKIVNIVGGAATTEGAAGKEIDMAACAPLLAQGSWTVRRLPDDRPQSFQNGRRPDLGARGKPGFMKRTATPCSGLVVAYVDVLETAPRTRSAGPALRGEGGPARAVAPSRFAPRSSMRPCRSNRSAISKFVG